MSLEDLNCEIRLNISDAPAALATLGKVQAGVDKVSTMAARGEFNVKALGAAFQTVAIASAPLALVGGNMGVLAGTAGLASRGVATLAAGFSVLHTLAVYLSAGLGFLMLPLHGLVLIPKLIMTAFSAMFAVILTPFKVLIGLITMTFRGLMTLMAPVIAIAKAFFMLKLGLHAIGLQFQILWKLMAVLPPQIRLLVVGLVALGAAGRAGSIAMGVLAAGIRAVSFAALVVTKPLRAMGVAAIFSAKSFGAMTVAAITGAAALAKMAAASTVAGLMAIGRAAVVVGTMIKTGLLAAVAAVSSALAVVGAIALYWGGKVAIGLESAETVFGVLLKDMQQGKALMAALNATKVAPFFDTKQIQDAGRDLIKAGVPVTKVTTKLEQLGQIAIATKTPIEDLSRIYRQGMARGAFQTDLVNQMAERGVDIFHALEKVTGQGGEALQKLMQTGKIGGEQMNAAIAHMTTGMGIYAGASDAAAKTTDGLWRQAKNNIGQVLGVIMTGTLSGFKGILESVVSVTEGMKNSVSAMSPVLVQFGGIFKDVFITGGQISRAIFTAIHGDAAATFSGVISIGMEWATKFRWFFQNFVDIAKFAFTGFQLFAVTAFNDIGHFFTTAMPAYLTWFGDNWRQVFMDAGSLILTVFSNIGTNIRNAMTQIWAFIKSGGTAELQFAFTPLLDGFVATVGKLPDIPARAMTQLEHDLTGRMQTLGTGLADNFDRMTAEARDSLKAVAVPNVELRDGPGAGGSGEGASDTLAKASKKAVENKAALVRSSEGQSFVSQFLAAQKKDPVEKRAAEANIQAAKDIHDIAREVQRGRPLATRAWT